jgi:acyl-CoA thioester hydrolase
VTSTGAPVQYVETVRRPHPTRARIESYPITGIVTARYADMDANAHLNNVAIESMHEDARAVLNSRVFPGIHTDAERRIRVVNSQSVVHFLAEAHWPCNVDTAIGVGRIGRTSFVLSSALFVDGMCISICDAVMVTVAEGPEPLTEDARARLDALALRTNAVDGTSR